MNKEGYSVIVACTCGCDAFFLSYDKEATSVQGAQASAEDACEDFRTIMVLRGEVEEMEEV